MTRHKSRLIIVIGICLLIILYAARVLYVNLVEYHHPQRLNHELGDTFEVDGLDVTITAAELIKFEGEKQISTDGSRFTIYTDDTTGFGRAEGTNYYLIAEAVVSNNGKEDATFLVPKITAFSDSNWSNGLSLNGYQEMNKDLSFTPTVKAGESIKIYLPYDINQLQYTYGLKSKLTDKWNDVEESNYSIVFSYYPTVNIVDVYEE